MNKNYGLGLVALLALGVNGCCKKEMMEEPQTALQETKKEEKPALVPGTYTGTINFNGKELWVTYTVSDPYPYYATSPKDCSLELSRFTSIRDERNLDRLYSLTISDEKCDGKAESLTVSFQYEHGSCLSIHYTAVELNERELKETCYNSLAARLLAAGKEVVKGENSVVKEDSEQCKVRQKGSKELNQILQPLTN